MNDHGRLVPAAPANMSPWVISVLQKGPLDRDAILKEVDALARAKGYSAHNIDGLKKTLNTLRKNGSIQNLRKGWWSLVDGAEIIISSGPCKALVGNRSIDVLRQIGKGDEQVYVYQSKEDVDRAKAENVDRWNCKVGKSKDAARRVMSSNSSAFTARLPEIGLLIRCDDADGLEKILHWSLRMAGQAEKHDAGHEWFRTSPHHIEMFYRAWLQACELLKQDAR